MLKKKKELDFGHCFFLLFNQGNPSDSYNAHCEAWSKCGLLGPSDHTTLPPLGQWIIYLVIGCTSNVTLLTSTCTDLASKIISITRQQKRRKRRKTQHNQALEKKNLEEQSEALTLEPVGCEGKNLQPLQGLEVLSVRLATPPFDPNSKTLCKQICICD